MADELFDPAGHFEKVGEHRFERFAKAGQPGQEISDPGGLGRVVVEGEDFLLGQVDDRAPAEPGLQVVGQLHGGYAACGNDAADWYGRFADGQPGVIVVEATGIRDIPSGPLLRAGHDRYIEGLTRLVDEVRRRSGGKTRLFIQLIDFLTIRRRPEPEKFLRRFLALSNPSLGALITDTLGEGWEIDLTKLQQLRSKVFQRACTLERSDAELPRRDVRVSQAQTPVVPVKHRQRAARSQDTKGLGDGCPGVGQV